LAKQSAAFRLFSLGKKQSLGILAYNFVFAGEGGVEAIGR
jgi:hypothetical protein